MANIEYALENRILMGKEIVNERGIMDTLGQCNFTLKLN